MTGSTATPPQLFHYCSASAFFSILKSRSIWLSSLSLANDTMEGRLVAKHLLGVADDTGLPPHLLNKLHYRLAHMERVVEGLAFCVSSKGDLLSQWRGYADNAQGFALGFSSTYLNMLATRAPARVDLIRVNYDYAEQRRRMVKIYDQLVTPFANTTPANMLIETMLSEGERTAAAQARIEAENSLGLGLLGLSTTDLYTMKGSAFEEEQEARLVRVAFPSLLEELPDEATEFRCSGGKIVPYVELPLGSLDAEPIVSVILGPKNPTPLSVVARFVEACGYRGVEVTASEATYR